MKISCPNCSAAYELDDSRVPPAGLSIKCPKCKNPFTVHKPKAGEAAKPAAKGAVPLPGQAGAKPAAAKAAGKPAPKTKGGSAVPLPGMGEAAAAASGAPLPAGAVPLPGLDAGGERTATDFRRPGVPGDPGAVPLPGLDEMPAGRAAGSDDPFANIDLGAPAPVSSRAAPPSTDLSLGEAAPPPSAPPKAGKPSPSSLADEGMNFDFVEPPKPAGGRAAGSDMLDFVDESTAVTPKGDQKDKKRPPPVVVNKPPESAEETLSLSDAGMEPPPEESSAPADPKKAEKERKKQEREERTVRDREERVRRKAARGPGLLQAQIVPALRSLAQPKRAVAVLILLGLAAVAVMGFRARRTPAGFFWSNRYLPAKKAATAAEAKVIEHGMQKLGQGDFAGAREALGAAAELNGVLPDDEEVKAFFVLAASELKLEYGQVGGDWDQAKRVVEKMKANGPPQNRARGAFALASGDFPKGKQILAAMGDTANADLESIWLYAQSLVLSGDANRGAQVLDGALKTRSGATKLLILRATVAREKEQLPEAAAFYQQALEKAPDNGRALVELAAVRLQQNDAKPASELLSKALDSDVRNSLDAAEEARANMLRGRLLSARHDPVGAEAAYERAVALDPNSARVHEGYGEFRLARREWDKAARQFEAAIANGGSAAAYAGAARAYLGQNRLLEADKNVNQAAAKDPSSAAYLFLQGKVADAIGKAEEAFRRYEAALQKKPDLVEALAAEGMVWVSRGDKARARERLDSALKNAAANSAIEDEAVGDLALALGDRQQAKAAFARALQKASDDPLAHAGMGKALAAEGDLLAARKELETGLGQVDTDASLYYEYGSLLRRMGEPDAALEALRKSVKLDSKEARYRARLGAVLVEKGHFEEAEQQLRQAVLLNDRYAEGLYYLARALAGRNNLSEAIDDMKKAIELEPSGEYFYHLGLIYERGQQVQDAIDALTRSIDKLPRNADALEHLGLNLMVENRFNEAVNAFKKAADLDSKRARLWAEVGDAEQQSGDVDGAIRDFQKALAQDSTLTGVWTRLGIAFKDKDCKGCRTRALDALRRATREDPADATAHHELGYMYKDDGQRRDAIAEFRRYLELRPDAGDVSTVQDDIYYLQEESRRAP